LTSVFGSGRYFSDMSELLSAGVPQQLTLLSAVSG